MLAVVISAWVLRGPMPVLLVIAGVLAIAAGLGLIFAGSFGLSASMSPLPKPAVGSTLVTSGVYRFIRHPIYVGLVITAVGAGVLSGSLVTLAIAVVLAVVLDLKSRREETWLRERYPDYAAYAEHTRRFLPGLY